MDDALLMPSATEPLSTVAAAAVPPSVGAVPALGSRGNGRPGGPPDAAPSGGGAAPVTGVPVKAALLDAVDSPAGAEEAPADASVLADAEFLADVGVLADADVFANADALAAASAAAAADTDARAAGDTTANADTDTAAARRQAYAAWLRRIAKAPWEVDLFQALRHIESAHPELPRLGQALRPADEPVRVGQPAEFTFAPAAVSGLTLPSHGGAKPQLQQRAFGLLGPNGPLPLHLTELTRERANVHADPVLQAFLDTLTHRFALLFYRAWAQAQPALGLDRPGHPDFARWLGALSGIGNDTQMRRDAVGDAAKLHFTGRLSRHVRDADGLLAWCRLQFDVPVRIEQWSGHWMALAADERTRLRGRAHAGLHPRDAQGLGRGAVLGRSVWDVQHKFRIVIGPLRLDRYRAFLPGGRDLPRLQSIVRQWTGLEFDWDLQLILARADVPASRLSSSSAAGGGAGSLGRTAWMGRYRRAVDADDLVIDVERVLHPHRRQRRQPSTTNPPQETTP